MEQKQITPQRKLQAILRNDFKSFVIKVFQTVSNDTYLDNWHIDVVCNEIEQMIAGENTRLIVNLPPRNMKSIICSVALPAYLLGKNPHEQIVCVSYSDDLSSQLANQFKMVVESQWYKYLFPGTQLKTRGLDMLRTSKGGYRFATSICGPLTGFGGNWIIIDDPLKAGDGYSDTVREKVNDWYTNTLYSRLNNKNTGRILVVMQRLHEMDLTGYLLSKAHGFKQICIPIIAEVDEDWSFTNKFGWHHNIIRRKGELLHDARENFDAVTSMRNMMSEFDFAGQYQQRPVPLEGGIVKRGWLKYYNDLPKIWSVVISWDTAAKAGSNNAYSACSVFGVCNGDKPGKYNRKMVLLETHRMKLETPALVKFIEAFPQEIWNKYRPYFTNDSVRVETIIEDASSGTPIIQFLHAKNIRVIGIKPEKDKETRLMGITHLLENGTVLLPNQQDGEMRDFFDELFKFPKSVFKDMVDSFSQGVRYVDDEYISGCKGLF